MERLQIHCNVERHTVETATTAHPNTQRGNFGATDIDPRSMLAPLTENIPLSQRINHRLLNPINIITDDQAPDGIDPAVDTPSTDQDRDRSPDRRGPRAPPGSPRVQDMLKLPSLPE